MICGATDDSQHVELYDGTRGVTSTFVASYESPVGQLHWANDLPQRFSGKHDSVGTLNDTLWGTGALISRTLFLTAGHCLDQAGNGWIRPRRNGVVISPEEIALLLHVNFKCQIDRATGLLRPGESFPVVALREYRQAGLDYSIVELGEDASGRIPGDVFGWLNVAATEVATVGSVLCIIHHPDDQGKKISAGTMLKNSQGVIAYNNIDVGGGSSGSPILSEHGEIVGVHIKGGCSTFGGANRGQSIGVIRAISKLI